MLDLSSAKSRYWSLRADLARAGRLFAPARHAFAREVLRTHTAHVAGRADRGEPDYGRALEAAVSWLYRAQDATADHGFSLGYFPCDWELGWRPSYPETTGYILQTLLDYAARFDAPEAYHRALSAAKWEIGIQMPSGAVQGGPVCAPERQRAAVFNTGMVLQGYTAAYRATSHKEFLEAGRRAADFLVRDIADDGHFVTHGSFVTTSRIKTYNVLCAWALIRFAEDAGESRYAVSAIANAEAAAGQQLDNGWFANNDLDLPDRPLTHTIGYTLQGLLEVGVCASRNDLIEHVVRGVEPLIQRIRHDGYLPGRFDASWTPAARSCCLTGSAQVAIVLYRLYQIQSNARFLEAADRLVDFVARTQRQDSADENLNGAIAGSYPLFGEYMKAGYPNWATKYFVDALMLREQTRAHHAPPAS